MISQSDYLSNFVVFCRCWQHVAKSAVRQSLLHSDLTIFFINTLNNLIEDNEPIIYVSIINIGLNKAISIKTSLVHDFSVVERENHRFIKKYNLKVDKEEKKITFLHLNPK